MKKSYLKRLVLNRETLIELDRIGLEGVAGGVTVRFCDFSADRENPEVLGPEAPLDEAEAGNPVARSASGRTAREVAFAVERASLTKNSPMEAVRSGDQRLYADRTARRYCPFGYPQVGAGRRPLAADAGSRGAWQTTRNARLIPVRS